MADTTGFEECVKNDSVGIDRTMATKVGLSYLQARAASGIEATEEQTFEDHAEHVDRSDRSHIICVSWPSVVFDDQADYSIVPNKRRDSMLDARIGQRGKDVNDGSRAQ